MGTEYADDIEKWKLYAQRLMSLNGAGIRALRLSAVKWPDDRTPSKLIADMIEGKDERADGDRMLDVVIAAERLVQRPSERGGRRWKELKRALDRLWTP